MADLEFEKTGVPAEKRASPAPEAEFLAPEVDTARSSPALGGSSPVPERDVARDDLRTAWNMGDIDLRTGRIGPDSNARIATSEGKGWTDWDRKEVRALLGAAVPSYLHNDAEANRLIDKIFEVEDPSFLDTMRQDMNLALNMTDDEYLGWQMQNIELSESAPNARRFLNAGLQSFVVAENEREHPMIAMARVQQDVSLAERQFGERQNRVAELSEIMDPTSLGLDADATPWQVKNALRSMSEFTDIIGRDGIYKTDGGHLLVTMDDDNGPMGAFVQLDEGTEIRNEIDALAALIEAKYGSRHKLITDEVEGQRAIGGMVTRTMGDIIRAAENAIPGENPLGKSDEDLRRDAEEITAEERESGKATAKIYAAMKASPEFAGFSHEGIYAAAAEFANDPEYSELTEAETFEMVKKRADEAGTWIPWLTETAMPPVVAALESYDKMVHQIGLTLMSQPAAIVDAFDSDPVSTYKDTLADALDNDYVSEYFGIEADSGWGMTMNLGASILFDPITWITPGGSASWKFLHETMTNPAMARHLLKTPAYRSAVRQVVIKNDTRIVQSLATGAFPEKHALRLLEITAENVPKGQRAARAAEIADMFEDAIRNSDWIPQGPRSLVQVKTTQGLGAIMKNNKLLPKKSQERLASLLARASKDRGASLSSDFSQRALDALLTAYPTDPDKVARLWKAALEAKEAGRAGTAAELKVLKAAQEQAKRKTRAATNRLVNSETHLVPQYRAFLDELDPLLQDADDLGKTVRVEDLGNPQAMDSPNVPGGLEPSDVDVYEVQRRARMIVEQFGDEFDQLDELRTAAWKEERRLAREYDRLANPKGNNAVERWWHEFYDEWADDIGVPRLEGEENVHPFLYSDGTPRQMHDWQAVTGEPLPPIADGAVDDVSWFGGYFGSDMANHADDIEGLRAMSVNPEATVTVMPASPMEMLMYANDYKLKLPEGVSAAVDKSLDRFQNLFAASVLMNLNTPVKTHGDEIIRFIQDAGFNNRSVFRANIPFARTNLSVPGEIYQRVDGSPSAARQRAWKMVDPSKKGQWRAAERFVNGSMSGDEIIGQYAQAVVAKDRSGFVKWWDEVGHQVYGKGPRGETMTANEAYEILERTTNYMLKESANLPAGTYDEIMEHLARGAEIDLPESTWRKFGMVPGQEHGSEGIIGQGFDLLYGKPSQRRGGQIFQHYYEFSRNMLIARHQRNGKNIIMDVSGTDEVSRLVDGGWANTADEAMEMLRQGNRNPRVREMIRDQGWKLESDINNAAASYARGNADSMMYQMATTSVLGKRLSRIYPWGRAQFDYLGYWSRKLLEPTEFQLQAGRKGIGKVRTAPPLMVAGRDVNPLNRVNVRLLDRIGHIATVGPQGEAGPGYGPVDVLDTFTFLPTALDESFLINDVSVSPGPVPSWFVNFLPEGHPLRDAWETIHPQHAIYNDYTNDGLSASVGNLLNGAFPTSPRSLRTTATQLATIGASWMGEDADAIYSTLTGLTEPPKFRDQLTVAWGDHMAENAFDPEFAYSAEASDDPSSYFQMAEKMREQAKTAAYQKEAMQTLRKQTGASSFLGESAIYAKYLMPIVDDEWLGRWVEAGYVEQGQADSLRAAAAVVGDELEDSLTEVGYETRQERKDFTRVGMSIIWNNLPKEERDRFIVYNPGIAVNMTSWVEINEDKVPDEWRKHISGGRVQGDDETRSAFYREGYDKGWIVPRDTTEWEAGIHARVKRAAYNEIANVYNELASGVTYAASGETKTATWATKSKKVAETWGQFSPEQWAETVGKLTDQLHIDIPDEWRQSDGTYAMTLGDLKEAMTGWRRRFRVGFESDPNIENVLNNTANGRKIWDYAEAAVDAAEDLGLEKPLELRDEYGDDYETMMQDFRNEVAMNPNFTVGMYNAAFADDFGPLDYEDPVPPPVADLDVAITHTPARFSVVDGDTVAYQTKDNREVRFRLLGVNAPEDNTFEGRQAAADLERALNQADEVTIGMFDRDRYGTTQPFFNVTVDGPERTERIFGWLYLDGDPVWFPEVFSPDNERGAPRGVTTEAPDFSRWMKESVS